MPRRRRSVVGFGALGATLGVLLLASSASASCSSIHGDPLPGYTGPLTYGIICGYATGPTETWTVPSLVTEAKFWLRGGGDLVGGVSGGRVGATLPLTPGETLVLESGGDGSASSVSRSGVPLLVAAGADGSADGYAIPEATEVTIEEPDASPEGFILQGSVSAFWSVPSGKPKDPDTDDPGNPDAQGRKPDSPDKALNCIVPRLQGKRPPAARRALVAAHCHLGAVAHKPAARSRRGRVSAQQPKPGTTLPERGTVSIVVGSRR